MGDLDSPLGRVPATERELQERGRLSREAQQRLDAMAKAEEAGRAAAADDAPRDISPESKALFGSRLSRIDERADAMPRIDTVVQDDFRLLRESAARGDALRSAERAELGVDAAREQRTSRDA